MCCHTSTTTEANDRLLTYRKRRQKQSVTMYKLTKKHGRFIGQLRNSILNILDGSLHQPLTSIFNPSKGIPVTSASRLQRYAVFLLGFTSETVYKSTKKYTNADALSRLPMKSNDNDGPGATESLNIGQKENLPVTAKEIAKEIRCRVAPTSR